MMKYIFQIMLLFVIINVNGQTFSGVVFTQDDKKPALFSTIHIPNTGLGTVTDEKGEFSFNIPEKYNQLTIEISFIGYKTLKLTISDLDFGKHNTLWLEVESENLNMVVLEGKRKSLKPLQIIKRVLKNVEKNYPTDTTTFKGYYRETVSQNGACVKYADAVVDLNYGPYQRDKLKYKEFYQGYESMTLSALTWDWGKRFHRGHFPFRTIPADKLKIIESRASENLSTSFMMANIEGGPLGLLGKDRMKYQHLFLKPSRFSNFKYTMKEVIDSVTNTPNYIIYFKPKFSEDKKMTLWKRLFKEYHDLVEGEIIVDKKTFAVKHMSYSVARGLKSKMCGFNEMNLKHFDYHIEIDYKRLKDKYYVSSIYEKDEFVYTDTINDTRTAFNTEQEIHLFDVQPNTYTPIKNEEHFANVESNQLFDYPLEYNAEFWNEFLANHKEYSIPLKIKTHLEKEKPLLTQFKNKGFRDLNLKPPVAKKEPYTWKKHGKTFVDDYAWLKDTVAPVHNNEVMNYVFKENEYYRNYVKPLRKDQRAIFKSLKEYSRESYTSHPNRYKNFDYYIKYKEDSNYPVYYRKHKDLKIETELFDVEKLALNHKYYNLSLANVSPNEKYIGFMENTTGSDHEVFKIKDMGKQQILDDSLKNIASVVWISDSTLLYTALENKTNRPYQVRLHKLNTSAKEDEILFTEENTLSRVGVQVSQHLEYAFISSNTTDGSEVYWTSLKDEHLAFKKMKSNAKDVKYFVSYVQGYFYVFTNENAKNGKLLRVKPQDVEQNQWETVIPHQEDITLETYEVFKDYLVYQEREDAQSRIVVRNLKTGKSHKIKVKEEYYDIAIGSNPEENTDSLEFVYSSFKTPSQTIRYNMATKKSHVTYMDSLKNFSGLGALKVKRIYAPAADGTLIPITLVYHSFRYWKKGKNNKLWLTSYGAYGNGQSVGFTKAILPLLERGFVYAVAHIRGGNDMGKQWYDDGKLMHKKNTFNDFISCTEFLINEGYADSNNVTIQGASAGGLLMGAVANKRPDLYKAVFLDVPFVDVMNTMLDDKLPLTTGEYLEWGNPNTKKAFNYMMSYSPYDNVKKQDYPAMFFSTGINDSKVGYWEPAKMVAKLRTLKTNNQPLLLQTDLTSGHGGGSGRYDHYKDIAMKFAILFELYRKDVDR